MGKENFLDAFYTAKPSEQKKRGGQKRRKPDEVYRDSTYSLTLRNLNYIAFRGIEFGTHSMYINMLIEKDRQENPEKEKMAQELKLAEMKRRTGR
ncbi:MAG: hypothetical protein IAA72_08530 [Spirochaetes bacterium]|uniref:Uncharacterized protein n=1 Tax=Candidatus Ornithospirochaeta stercoravium TaxID=2840897 RepID=A0A9D9IC03_9SPIO|nr:hypothetical protein [Candidatus Ornithospirochaeta stercoravium]